MVDLNKPIEKSADSAFQRVKFIETHTIVKAGGSKKFFFFFTKKGKKYKKQKTNIAYYTIQDLPLLTDDYVVCIINYALCIL